VSKKGEISIVFLAEDGIEKTIVFTRKPLGFQFNTSAVPVVVKGVTSDGHAEDLGVKPGWQIVTVNREQYETYGEFFSDLSELIAMGELQVQFRLPDGNVREVTFSEVPVGFSYNRNRKIIDVSEGGHASTKGVKVGWEITRVNNVYVTDADQMDGLLGEAVRLMRGHSQ